MCESIALTLLIAVLFTGCSTKPNTSEIFVMNTYVTQTVYGRSKNTQKAIDEVNTFLITAENLLSTYVVGSDVDKVNQNAGVQAIKVDSFTIDLFVKANQYCEATDGRFDITIAPLSKLWGITGDSPRVPAQAEIDSTVELIDYSSIVLDVPNSTAFLAKEGMQLDLGGIAKGYVCTEIREIYKKNNVDAGLVSIGGNIMTYGKKTDGSQFVMGIRDPNGSATDILGKLKSEDTVIATTGGYERYFEENGKVYHHILDPQTGYPVESDLISVTVISKDGGLADFLSTALFIQGSDQMEKYLNHEAFSVIVVDKNNNVYISDNIKSSFELTAEGYSEAR